MNINELPPELLGRILSFLRPSERLDSALTCRRWAQAFTAPALTRDICFVIKESQMDEAESVLLNSHRQYENLRLFSVDLIDFKAAFWTTVGPRLRKLRFSSCSGLPGFYHSILVACPNLESLEIDGSCISRLPAFELLPGMNIQSIQNSMSKLRHLHLDSLVDEDVLEHLLNIMPNVSSVGLAFEGWTTVNLSHLPNILGTSRRITMLDLFRNDTNEYEQLLRSSSASLRELRLRDDELPRGVYEALGNCRLLSHLSIPLSHAIDDHLLQNILRSVPELETLELWEGLDLGQLTSDSLMPILELESLRELDLSDLTRVTSAHACGEVLRNIAGMSSLATLKLHDNKSGFDDTSLRSLASLPNLRRLEISSNNKDVLCLRAAFLRFRKLEALRISGGCYGFERGVDEHSEFDLAAFVSRAACDRQEEAISSSLADLTISCTPLTDAHLGYIAAHHSRLKRLHLHYCHEITDAGLVALLQHEPLLEKLHVTKCRRVDGLFRGAVSEELCPRLRVLNHVS